MNVIPDSVLNGDEDRPKVRDLRCWEGFSGETWESGRQGSGSPFLISASQWLAPLDHSIQYSKWSYAPPLRIRSARRT